MLLVRTRVGISEIHGLGLFADQFIPKGTVTWVYHPEFDPVISDAELNAMPAVIRRWMLHVGYFDAGLDRIVIPLDNQQFINHSARPERINIVSTPRSDVASRDIEPGEELLCDYTAFEPGYFQRTGIKAHEMR